MEANIDESKQTDESEEQEETHLQPSLLKQTGVGSIGYPLCTSTRIASLTKFCDGYENCKLIAKSSLATMFPLFFGYYVHYCFCR